MPAIRVELELVDGTFTSRLVHAGQTVKQFNQTVAQASPALAAMADKGQLVIKSLARLEGNTKSFLSTVRDITTTAASVTYLFGVMKNAASGFLGQIVQVNSDIEKLRTLLSSMSSAADPFKAAANQVKYLRDMAQNAPFSFKGLTETFVRMKSTGIDPMNGAMQSLVDAVAAFGGTDQVMERAALAIQQMSGKGVIQMEELRQQLGEAIPRATELMARGMGVSYAQLVQAISTGRVKAQPALKAMFEEFRRTFGGGAANMMDTFSGQWSKMITNLQNRALEVGNAGYFDAVKKQLEDFNTFLQSSDFERMAVSFGRGLTTAVNAIREAIDWVSRFRGELLKIGEYMVGAFIATRVLSGLKSVADMFRSGANNAALFRVELATLANSTSNLVSRFDAVGASVARALQNRRNDTLFNEARAAALASVKPYSDAEVTAAIAAYKSRMAGAAQATAGVGIAARAAQGGLGLMGRAIGAAAFAGRGLVLAMTAIEPWLVILGTGLLVAAGQFDIFGDAAKDALDKVTQFGATTKDELEKARQGLAKEQAEFNKLLEEREASVKRASAGRLNKLGAWAAGMDPKEYKAQQDAIDRANFDAENNVTERQKNLANLAEQFAKREAEFKEAQIEDASRAELDDISKRQRARQREYDTSAKKLMDFYDKQRAAAEKSGRTQITVEQNFQRQLRRLRVDAANDKLEMLEEYYKKEVELSKSSDPVQAEAARRVLDDLHQRIKDLRAEKEQASKPITGIELTPKVGGFEKTLQKGQDLLEKLRADAIGLQADLAGANGEVDKLIYELMQGKFGDPLNGKVKELINQLIQAQDEVETLQDAMKGKNKLDTDIENARQKAYERYYDALAGRKGDLTETQKIELKLNLGYYGPVANNPMVAQMEGMRSKIAEVKEEALQAGRELQTSMLGVDVQRNAKFIAERVQDIATAWKSLNKEISDSPIGSFIKLFTNQADAATEAAEKVVEANDAQAKSAESASDVIQNTILAPVKKNPLAESIEEIRSGMKDVRQSATDAGAAITGNAFGSATQSGMSSVVELVGQLKSAWVGLNGVIQQSPLMAIINGTGTALGALVSNIQSLVGFGIDTATGGSAPYKTTDPVAPELTPVEKALLNAIAGPESGGAYNVRYSPNGAKTFDPEMGHPRIYEPTKDGRKSSAAGRYQFTAETFDDLGGTSFTPAAQDRLALELARREYLKNGGGDLLSDLQINGLTEEILKKIAPRWEGLKEHPRRAIATYNETYGRSIGKPLAGQQGLIDETKAIEKAATAEEGKNFAANMLEELKTRTEDLNEATEDYSKNVQKVQEAFAKGKFGPDVTKESQIYKDLIAQAKEKDRVEQQLADRKKLRNKYDNATESLSAKEKEFRDKAEEYARQLELPGGFKNDNAYYSLKKQLDEYVSYAKELYDQDVRNQSTSLEKSKQAYADAIQYRKNLLGKYESNELLKFAGELAEKNVAGAQSLMTDADRRKAAYDQEMAVLNDFLAKVRASESMSADMRVQIERSVIERKRQLNEQYNQDGPIAQQMKQWSDFGKNFETATAGWMDSFADNLASLITTGKADFKSLATSIISDMAKMAIKWATSSIYKSLFGGGGNKTAKGAGTAAKGSKAGTGGPLNLAGLMSGGFAEGGSIVGPGTETSDSIMTWLSNGEYLVNAKSAKKWRPILEAMNDNNAAAAKKIKAFRRGGKIVGEGTGTSDSILAKVSNGEFVVKAAATSKYYEVLEAINNDALTGMNLPKFATGGLVGANDSKGQPVNYGDRTGGAMGAGQVNQPISISSNVTVNAAGGTPEQNADLAKQVSKSVESNIRQLVTSEMMKQMRPGGLLRQGSNR